MNFLSDLPTFGLIYFLSNEEPTGFIIIAWIGVKLGVDYLHDEGYVAFAISQWLSIGLVVAIFVVALIYARAQGPVERVSTLTEKAEEILDGREG